MRKGVGYLLSIIKYAKQSEVLEYGLVSKCYHCDCYRREFENVM